ncbi:arginase family protein, partial [Bacillus pseudomycoides]|uniref:arginase family protein n=2 Tax=Bacillaceae TaxID=186817 RepID=UPI000C0299EE
MKKEISVIGVPMDLGQMRRGVDMGPSAIRYAGVVERIEEIGYNVKDMGDICIEREKEVDENTKLRNLTQVATVCNELASKVDHIIEEGRFPLV